MSVLSETRAFYKQKKAEEKLKRKLLGQRGDFHLLEELIQKCNENPDLRIEVRCKDGTRYFLKCYHKAETHDLIDGNYNEVIE